MQIMQEIQESSSSVLKNDQNLYKVKYSTKKPVIKKTYNSVINSKTYKITDQIELLRFLNFNKNLIKSRGK